LTYRIQFVRSAAKAYSRLDAVLQRRVNLELNHATPDITPPSTEVNRIVQKLWIYCTVLACR